MDIVLKIKEELKVEKWQVEAAIKLIDEGNTIPFISRYRKEVTGSLNDEQLRNLDERLKYLRGLEERREQVLASIEEQGKMTDELKAKIIAAETMVAIEDLYLPYRPKRKTRASVAREKGLEPLAQILLLQETTKPLQEEAAAFVEQAHHFWRGAGRNHTLPDVRIHIVPVHVAHRPKHARRVGRQTVFQPQHCGQQLDRHFWRLSGSPVHVPLDWPSGVRADSDADCRNLALVQNQGLAVWPNCQTDNSLRHLELGGFGVSFPPLTIHSRWRTRLFC